MMNKQSYGTIALQNQTLIKYYTYWIDPYGLVYNSHPPLNIFSIKITSNIHFSMFYNVPNQLFKNRQEIYQWAQRIQVKEKS